MPITPQDYPIANKAAKLQAFERILQMMNELRAQCPWDKKQTIQSLRILTIEEMYELADAITEGNMQHIKEELGDIMLHLVFYSKIGEEQNSFDIADVINSLCDKMVARHPHIYGDVKVKDADEVTRNWEQLKLQEQNADANAPKSVLAGVPESLPAMVKAFRIQSKAQKVGFEWDTAAQVLDKVNEELAELQEAIDNNNTTEINKEFGDVLFSLINYARFLDVDPENALATTNQKFINRFKAMEKQIYAQNNTFADLNLAQMDAIWNEVKKDFK